MKNSKPESGQSKDGPTLRETASPYALDLPINRAMPDTPPKGTWEDGWRLSQLALGAVENRPEIFAQRDERMCFVEFRM